jgi:glycosyltransferase involved in cell wall biosynthesis
MKKIIFFCPFANDLKGGVQRFASELIEEMKTQDVQISSLFWDKHYSYFRGYLLLLKNFLKLSKKANLIHFMVPSPYIIPALLVGRCMRKKIVVTYHAVYPYEISFRKEPTSYLLFYFTDRIARRFSNRIVSSNMYTIRELKIKKNYNIICHPVNMRTIPLSDNIITKPVDSFIFSTASSFNIEKKVKPLSLLIKAICELHNEKERIQLMVFGDGKFLPRFRDDFQAYENIVFMGFRSDFTEYINKSHAYIHITGLDTQPYAVIDAMLRSKIVLANDLDSILEMLDPESNYIVKLEYDSIKNGLQMLMNDLKNNPTIIQHKCKQNKQFAFQRYSSIKNAAEYIKLYDHLLKKPI